MILLSFLQNIIISIQAQSDVTFGKVFSLVLTIAVIIGFIVLIVRLQNGSYKVENPFDKNRDEIDRK